MNSEFRNEDTVYFTSSDSAADDVIDQDTNKLISTMKQFCAANTSNATCSCFNTAMSYLSDYNSKYKEWKDTTDALQADYYAKTDRYNKAYSSKKIQLDNYITNKSTYTHWGGINQSPSEPPPIECTNNNIYKCTSTNQGDGPNTTRYDWIIMLTNNVHSIYDDWPRNSEAFKEYITYKYGSLQNAMSTTKYYYDADKNIIDVIEYSSLPTNARSLETVYEYELQLNVNKSRIKILNRNAINSVESGLRSILSKPIL